MIHGSYETLALSCNTTHTQAIPEYIRGQPEKENDDLHNLGLNIKIVKARKLCDGPL